MGKNVFCCIHELVVHIHTIDGLTESNVGIALDEILDNFWIDLDKFIDKLGTKSWI